MRARDLIAVLSEHPDWYVGTLVADPDGDPMTALIVEVEERQDSWVSAAPYFRLRATSW